MFLCTELHHGELKSPHRTGPDVSDLAASDQIIESAHCLFNWGEGIEAMNPEKVDVVGF